MATHVLLSVDLPNHVTSEKRTKFNEKLAELHWIKLHHLDTVWRCFWKDGVGTDTAITVAKNDVKTAAVHGGIGEYHAVAHVGENQPTEF